MESPAEKYQRMMKEKMQTLQNILDESEYSFTNIEDACGDEIYEIFKKAAVISGGFLEYISGETTSIDERNFIVKVIYKFNKETESKTINLNYKLERGIEISQVANELNEMLKLEGYSDDRCFYDISQDVDMAGLAFTNFSKELKLFESGVIWRGRSESENSEGFEYFWTELNKYNLKKQN